LNLPEPKPAPGSSANPQVVAQLGRLSAAIGNAQIALAQCGPADDSNDDAIAQMMRKLLDNTKEAHAWSDGDIKGTTPMEVILSLVGKGAGLAKKGKSVHLAVLRTRAVYRWMGFAKQAPGIVAKAPKGSLDRPGHKGGLGQASALQEIREELVR